jgi:hypothetical protein
MAVQPLRKWLHFVQTPTVYRDFPHAMSCGAGSLRRGCFSRAVVLRR